MISSWLHQRANLNHRWLQNEYSIFLYRLASGGVLTKEWANRLNEWKNRHDELVFFVENSELALSPKQLLNVYPLSELHEQHREWLEPLIHEYYCSRSGIRNKIKQLKEKISEVDRILITFQVGISQPEAGKEMYQLCLKLSEMISVLPKEIQI